MSGLSGALEGGFGVGGSWIGGAAGGAAGTALCGPVCGFIGRALGSRAGGLAGRALGGWLASQMEGADSKAESKTKAKDAAVPCENCGKIDCFNPPENGNREEFERQLDEQEKAINEIPPDDILKNMKEYADAGRGAADARERARIRRNYITDRSKEIRDNDSSIGINEALAKATKEASVLDVIHTPDLSAGGTGATSPYNGGLADRSSNRSIGSQWKDGRLDQLEKHAKEAKRQGKKMNVKLEICDDKNKGGEVTPTKPKVAPKNNIDITPGDGISDGMV